MNFPEQIKTIKKRREYTLKEKKSVFTAIAIRVSTQEEAREILKEVKKKYYDATHHCYAYKLVDGKEKFSDAGEPTGTAGIRILNAIEHFKLTDMIAVVVRYYGGIQLGTGPLGKAYYKAASNVIKESEIITKELFQKVKIISEIKYLCIVYDLLSRFESRIESTEFKTKPEINCFIKPSKLNEIIGELRNKSSGEVKYNIIDEYLYL